MTETKIGYKVLQNIDGLSSATGYGYRTDYFKNKKTFRKLCNGGLTLFKTIKSAKSFLCNNTIRDSHTIYKCKYKPEKHPNARKLKYIGIGGELWEFYGVDPYSPPKGTEYARWIIPIKEIPT